MLIVLDEVDHINDDSLLYKLPRARSNDDVTDVRLGVIGISNDLDFRNQLSSKVRSSLCEKEVSFSAYNATELREVLRQREAVAFKDGVLDSGVIGMCAAYGAKDSGDVRQALAHGGEAVVLSLTAEPVGWVGGLKTLSDFS